MAKLRLRSSSEHEIQRAIVGWARDAAAYHPDLELLYMVPNASNGLEYQMWKWLESMGLLPGLPDLCLPVARGGAFGRWLEVKPDEKELRKAIDRITRTGTRHIETLSKADDHIARQMRVHDALREQGHLVDFVCTPKQGIDLLLEYVKSPRTVAIPFAQHDEEMKRG